MTDSHNDPNLTTERLLRDSRLAMLLDAAVDGIVVVDDELCVTWANRGAASMVGRPLDELIGTNILDVVHPDDLAMSSLELSRLMEGVLDDPASILRVTDAEGRARWLEVKGSDLRSVADIAGIVLTARDVSHRHELEEALAASRRRFESLLRHSNDGMVILDTDMRLTYASPSIEKLTGFPPSAMVGYDALIMVLEPEKTELLEAFGRVLASADVVESVRVCVRHRNGHKGWFEVRVSNRMDDPAIAGVIVNIRDIDDIVRAESETARLIEIFDLTEDLVTVVDGEGALVYMNSACARFLGMRESEIPIGQVWAADHVMNRNDEGCTLNENERTWTTETLLNRFDGVGVPYTIQVIAHAEPDGTISRYSVLAHDISESRRLADSLEQQALHDPLTSLPNRALLERRMRQLSEKEGGANSSVAVLFIDLDHFKVINDSLGHEFGDELLKAVARRLVNLVRPRDTVARFGGDEFVILCDGVVEATVAHELAERISEAMLEPVIVDGAPIHVSVSVGIAVAPGESFDLDPGGLIRDADTAMYRAKSQGRGTVVLFDEELRRRAVERQRTESALRQASLDGSLELHYQPIVVLATGRIRTLEALVRWNHDGRLVGPNEFIPVAEESGLIVQLGAWVLSEACQTLARWRRIAGWDQLRVAVNVSPLQLREQRFCEMLLSVLNDSGLPGNALTLEITESLLLDDSEIVNSHLAQIRKMGVELSVDDFGTGYSSLTYLAKLPVGVVKLDRTFLQDAARTDDRTNVISGVLQLVRAFGLKCTAEGIESEEQFRMLADLGCDRGQGYHIARPMDAFAVESRLRNMSISDSWPRVGELGLHTERS